MKIVFFGTSNVALPVLENLNRHHEVAAVVTQPDAPVGRSRQPSETPVSVLAGEMGVRLLKPDHVKGNSLLRVELQDLKADLFVVVAYGKILPAEIIALPELKSLNVHFSLLPKYRGAAPIQYALLNGEMQTGTSIMVMDEQLDHGPVVTAERISIDADDNYITLSEKLAHVSAKLLELALPDYAAGRLLPAEQNHELATYTKIITKDDGRIDWSRPAEAIYNQFRAFYPWPGIWTAWNGKKLKITECFPSPLAEPGPSAGTVLEDGYVSCGAGTKLKVVRLQLEGKTETDMQSFINGYRDFTGSSLG